MSQKNVDSQIGTAQDPEKTNSSSEIVSPDHFDPQPIADFLRKSLGPHVYEHITRRYGNAWPSTLDSMLQLCEAAQELFSENEVAERTVFEIIIEGTLHGKEIPQQLPGRWSIGDVVNNRMVVAELFIQNPEFATVLIEKSCIGGHGSKSGSFFDVMNNGLRPRRDLAERGISVTTGEAVYGSSGLNQEYLSAAQWTDIKTLKHYASMGIKGHTSLVKLREMREEAEKLIEKSIGSVYESAMREGLNDLDNSISLLLKTPESESDRLRQYFSRANFPVVYMIGGEWKNEFDPEQLENTEAMKVRIPVSDVHSEFVIKDGVDIANIQIILVPRKNFGDVSSLVDQVNAKNGLDIQIFALEDYQRLSMKNKLYDVT